MGSGPSVLVDVRRRGFPIFKDGSDLLDQSLPPSDIASATIFGFLPWAYFYIVHKTRYRSQWTVRVLRANGKPNIKARMDAVLTEHFPDESAAKVRATALQAQVDQGAFAS